AGSNGPAAADGAQEDHDERDHEEDVDEAAQRVRGHEAEKPEHDEYDGERIEHVHLRWEVMRALWSTPRRDDVGPAGEMASGDAAVTVARHYLSASRRHRSSGRRCRRCSSCA